MKPASFIDDFAHNAKYYLCMCNKVLFYPAECRWADRRSACCPGGVAVAAAGWEIQAVTLRVRPSVPRRSSNILNYKAEVDL